MDELQRSALTPLSSLLAAPGDEAAPGADDIGKRGLAATPQSAMAACLLRTSSAASPVHAGFLPHRNPLVHGGHQPSHLERSIRGHTALATTSDGDGRVLAQGRRGLRRTGTGKVLVACCRST